MTIRGSRSGGGPGMGQTGESGGEGRHVSAAVAEAEAEAEAWRRLVSCGPVAKRRGNELPI